MKNSKQKVYLISYDSETGKINDKRSMVVFVTLKKKNT